MPERESQIIIYKAEDGQTKIDVRFENETVWLSQKQLAELFQVAVPTVNEHIKNIYTENELSQDSTIRNFRIVQKEGSRQVARKVDYYNLDLIISVGYRIKSNIATTFRQWATQRLREYIVKGFVLDVERLKNPDLPFDYFEERKGATAHDERRVREYIISKISKSAGSILDVGCGRAWVAKHYIPKGVNVYSLDISETNPAKAVNLYPSEKHFAIAAD